MSFQKASDQLAALIPLFQQLSEAEQFALGRQFNQETGGKLSPYNSPGPVTVAIIPVWDSVAQRIQIITPRRAIAPEIGKLALPGGFIEHHENAIDGMVREIKEELGLSLNPALFTVAGSPVCSTNNNMLIFYQYGQVLQLDIAEARGLMEGACCADENSELVYADPGTPLAFTYHQSFMDAAFERLAALPQDLTIPVPYMPYLGA